MASLIGSAITESLPDWLDDRASASPGALALIHGERRWTYRQLAEDAARWAGWLASQGIREGERVGVLLPNIPEYVLVIHALMRLGAVAVLLNTRLTAQELRYQVDVAGCAVVIGEPGTSQRAGSLGRPIIDLSAYNPEGIPPAPPRAFRLADVQAILFTSGTSGKPKGAQLTYSNHFYGAVASAFRAGVYPHDRWLCILPLYHVGGLSIVMRSVLYGTCIVLQNGFDVATVSHALDHQGVTLASLVPTMLYRLLDARQGQAPPPDLRLVLLGGAAADRELVERSHMAGFPVVTTYGLTEACSQVATQTVSGTLAKPASVGKPLSFVRVRIVDEAGNAVAPGVPGEIVVESPMVMRGYLGADDASERALRDHNALYTGDIGYLDEDGDLWLLQRRSDLIVTGGENVYPAEVEAVLKRHPSVEAVCVVGVPHPEWGQQVAAMVVLRATGRDDDAPSPSADDLIAFCRGALAGYKIPRQIRFADALPLTASGKIERKQVAALLGAESDRRDS